MGGWNLKEAAVDALFAAGLGFNGFVAEFKRGGVSRRVRGFFVSGGSVATVSALNFVSAETREFVVERDELGDLFPPQPRDELEIDEPGAYGSTPQRYEVFADEGVAPFRVWNHARRYIVINLIEREDERK